MSLPRRNVVAFGQCMQAPALHTPRHLACHSDRHLDIASLSSSQQHILMLPLADPMTRFVLQPLEEARATEEGKIKEAEATIASLQVCPPKCLSSHALHSHALHSHALHSHALHSHALHSHALHSHALHSHALHSHALHAGLSSPHDASHSLHSRLAPTLRWCRAFPASSVYVRCRDQRSIWRSR
ncbi:unnamed protein product [Closterium sp. NIES-54]